MIGLRSFPTSCGRGIQAIQGRSSCRAGGLARFSAGALVLLGNMAVAIAQSTNSVPSPTALPDLGVSAIRALGALALVLALFFGGVWFFRNGQRLSWRRNGPPHIAVFETRSLGNRCVLYLIGCDRQRLLVGSSPTGLTLISRLPPAAESASETLLNQSPAGAQPCSFAGQLQRLLAGQGPAREGKPGAGNE